jgi:hypothetical protein
MLKCIVMIKKILNIIKFYIWRFKFFNDKRLKLLKNLYCNLNGYNLSKEARKDYDSIQYLYGEINYSACYALLSLCSINENTVFCDLGSGVGKPTTLAALFFPLKYAFGVEKFNALYQAATQVKTQLSKISGYQEISDKINFYNQDLFEFDFSQCNLVLINIIGFTNEDRDKLNKKLVLMPKGSLVITISKPLNNSNFNLVKECMLEMSWGITHAYIHKFIVTPHHVIPNSLGSMVQD